jgi:hypothetical protein
MSPTSTTTGTAARDHVSTIDAGDLPLGTVAETCWWADGNPGVKNDLDEADVEFNTHDYNFTDTGSSDCNYEFDIRSVMTHETGHVFGLGDLPSSTHGRLTMYGTSYRCRTLARTLGLGDVHGLWRIYG